MLHHLDMRSASSSCHRPTRQQTNMVVRLRGIARVRAPRSCRSTHASGIPMLRRTGCTCDRLICHWRRENGEQFPGSRGICRIWLAIRRHSVAGVDITPRCFTSDDNRTCDHFVRHGQSQRSGGPSSAGSPRAKRPGVPAVPDRFGRAGARCGGAGPGRSRQESRQGGGRSGRIQARDRAGQGKQRYLAGKGLQGHDRSPAHGGRHGQGVPGVRASLRCLRQITSRALPSWRAALGRQVRRLRRDGSGVASPRLTEFGDRVRWPAGAARI
jgi:hypothetical protein